MKRRAAWCAVGDFCEVRARFLEWRRGERDSILTLSRADVARIRSRDGSFSTPSRTTGYRGEGQCTKYM